MNDAPEQVTDRGRREHYGQFYGLHTHDHPELPLLVVYGNCQAEATRVLLEGAAAGRWRTLRMPPVHELEAGDLPHLRTVLASTTYLVAQPVVDGYRDLPLGTREVADLLPQHARIAMFPSIRWAALYPTQVIVRVPGLGDPPAVPYHDLRVLLAASEGRAPVFGPIHPDGVRAVRDDSAAQLRARQTRHATVDAATILQRAGAETTWVINHPHNLVLREVARALLAALGLVGDITDPGRVLLGDLRAPVHPGTLQALGIEGTPREQWSVRGEQVSEQQIADEQLRWYADHPEVISAGLRKHADAIRALHL